MRTRTVVLAALFLSASALAQTPAPGPVGIESGSAREQSHWVPFPAAQQLLLMRVCRPPGEGPHKLAVINHGSPPRAEQRPTMEPTGCDREVSRWFLSQGFAVAYPMRRGFGKTAGNFAENFGSCSSPDYYSAGLSAADDVAAALAYVSGPG